MPGQKRRAPKVQNNFQSNNREYARMDNSLRSLLRGDVPCDFNKISSLEIPEYSTYTFTNQTRIDSNNSLFQRTLATAHVPVGGKVLWKDQNQSHLPKPSVQFDSHEIDSFSVQSPQCATKSIAIDAGSINTIDSFDHGEDIIKYIEMGTQQSQHAGCPFKEIAIETFKDVFRPVVLPKFTANFVRALSANQDHGKEKDQYFGANFVPGPWDVICGRGKTSYDHVGNRRLRLLIATKLNRYVASKKRREKTAVIDEIVQQIQSANPCGGFVRKIPTMNQKNGVAQQQHHWYRLGTSAARDRVSHAIRDCLPTSLRHRSKEIIPSSDRMELLRMAEHAMVLSSVTPLQFHHAF